MRGMPIRALFLITLFFLFACGGGGGVADVAGTYPNRTTSPDIQELSSVFPNSSLLDFARHCEPILDINHDGAVNGSDSDILLQGPYRSSDINQCEWVSAETWGFQHIRYSNYGLIDLASNPDIAGVVFELYEQERG